MKRPHRRAGACPPPPRPARAVRSSARGGRGGQAARATVLRYTLAIAALVLAGCAQSHDGTPFTSADMLFTAEVVQDREVGVFRNRAYDAIDSVTAPDPSTVTIKWKRPYIAADTMFSPNLGMPMPKHLLEKAYATDKAGMSDLLFWSDEFVGTGPFKLQSWERGTHMILVAND